MKKYKAKQEVSVLKNYFDKSVEVNHGNYVRNGSLPDRAQWLLRKMVTEEVLENGMKSVIDFGCGPGDLLAYLKKKNPKILLAGVDLSENMIRQAKKRVSGATILKADISEKLPMVSKYDAVVCLNTLHHLSHRELKATLNQMGMVAKRMIVLEIKNPWSIFTGLLWVDLKFIKVIPVFLHRQMMISKLLKRQGWEKVKQKWIFQIGIISPFGMYVFKKRGS